MKPLLPKRKSATEQLLEDLEQDVDSLSVDDIRQSAKSLVETAAMVDEVQTSSPQSDYNFGESDKFKKE